MAQLTMNRRRISAVIAGCAALAVWGAVPATARRRYRLRFGSGLRGGNKNYSGAILNRSELEECLRMHGRNDQLMDQVGLSERVINDRNSVLVEMQGELELRRSTLDRSSQTEVDKFNAEIAAFEEQRLAFNEAVQGHNDLVQSANQILSSFNATCANKQYYEDDMRAAELAVGIQYNP